MAQDYRGTLPSESARHSLASPPVRVEPYSQAANTDEGELSRMLTDSAPSCKQVPSGKVFQHTQDAPAEGVLSSPSVEFLSSPTLDLVVILLVPTLSFSHLPRHSSLIDNSLPLIVGECLVALQHV